MHFVYFIKSVKYPDQTYIGCTEDVFRRLVDHNASRSPHTAKYKPWELIAYVGFKDKVKAIEFERYLKSGSGRSFAAKRLLS